MHENPDYNLSGTYCQNFTKYFIDAISPGALRPETIKTILERFISPVKVPPSLVSASWGFGSYLNSSENPLSPLPSPLADQFPFHSTSTSYETPLHGSSSEIFANGFQFEMTISKMLHRKRSNSWFQVLSIWKSDEACVMGFTYVYIHSKIQVSPSRDPY